VFVWKTPLGETGLSGLSRVRIILPMNCLAHAINYLDDPWFLIGTGMPDWLSMADRQVRLRPKHLDLFKAEMGQPARLMAEGIRQHWADDEWFHRTVAFHEVTSQIGILFRDAYGSADRFRSGFVGHIAMEMLIDAILSERQPDALDRYYSVVENVDAGEVESIINSYGAKQTNRIQLFLARYLDEQFLRDYTDDDRLLYRLNRVLNRVRLDSLPDRAAEQVATARLLVRERCDELLTPG
jgi:hypothetical protein